MVFVFRFAFSCGLALDLLSVVFFGLLFVLGVSFLLLELFLSLLSAVLLGATSIGLVSLESFGFCGVTALSVFFFLLLT